MIYQHLRIKDEKLFWKLKIEAPKRRVTVIEAVEEALKDWLKKDA